MTYHTRLCTDYNHHYDINTIIYNTFLRALIANIPASVHTERISAPIFERHGIIQVQE